MNDFQKAIYNEYIRAVVEARQTEEFMYGIEVRNMFIPSHIKRLLEETAKALSNDAEVFKQVLEKLGVLESN